jgi:hypothetical protein
VAGDSPASLADFDSWVLRTVLNPQVPLFPEARYLLAEETEIQDTALYRAVLGAPLRRSQIQMDVAVFAPDYPGRPRRVLSLGEAKWDKVMTLGRLERLRRARELLAVKGYDMSATRLAYCIGAGFDHELGDAAKDDRRVQLIGLDTVYDLH